MSNLLAQIILARRSPDDEGWMNILVVIVMAVIWIVGGVVKAMKTKSQEQQPRRVPPRKPPNQGRGAQQQTPAQAQRPAGPAQDRRQPAGVQAKRMTLADLREAARRFAAEAEQAFQGQTTQPVPKEPGPPAKPAVRPEVTPSIEPAIAPIKGVAEDQSAAAKIPPAQYLPDLASDYADPESLRKAILHYEILGPPLSLRQ